MSSLTRLVRLQIAALLAFSLVMVWLAASYELRLGRVNDEQAAEAAASFEAQAEARAVSANLARVDELLIDMRAHWLEHPENFEILLAKRQPYLGDLLLQLSVIDRDGYLRFSNLEAATGRLYLGNREHFKVHRERREDRLYISQPVLGAVSKRWSIQLSRPILGPDGFAGVLVASLEPDVLLRADAGASSAPGTTTLVATQEGSLLSIRPHDRESVGGELTGYPFKTPDAPQSGHLRRPSPADGADAIFGFQRIPEFGLIVLVGHSTASILAAYYEERPIVFNAAALVSVLMTLGFLLLWRSLRSGELAQGQIQASQEILQSSIDAIGEAFVIYDRNDRLVYCNREYRQMYATSAAAMERGASFEDIIRYGVARGQYADAVGREEEWIAERMAAHHSGINVQIQRLNDGKWIRVRERRTPEGYIVGFRLDISELMASQALAEEAREAAEEASQAKSTFLANVSHELQTPLNGIVGIHELLHRGALEPAQRELLANLGACIRRLRELVSNLLDFSALEGGRLPISVGPMRLADLFATLLQQFAGRAAAQGVGIDHTIDHDVPVSLQSDGRRLAQVLYELLDNALKFTETGSISIRAFRAGSADERHFRLGLAVRDSGIGIAPDDLEMIFRPFTQKDSSPARRHGGTGLGLSLARGIVREMRGEIEVHSVPGYGSTFTVIIECAR